MEQLHMGFEGKQEIRTNIADKLNVLISLRMICFTHASVEDIRSMVEEEIQQGHLDSLETMTKLPIKAIDEAVVEGFCEKVNALIAQIRDGAFINSAQLATDITTILTELRSTK